MESDDVSPSQPGPAVNKASNGLARSTASSMLWVGWGKTSFAILQIAFLSVLAHLIPPEEFGVLGVALIAIGFAEVFSRLGLATALVQRSEVRARHERTALVSVLVLSFGVGTIVWFLADPITRFLGVPDAASVLRVTVFLLPIKSVGEITGALLSRDLQFSWLARVEVTTYVLGYGLIAVSAALAGWDVWALVAGHFVWTSLKVIGYLARRRPAVGSPDARSLRDLSGFSLGITLGRLPNVVAGQGDNAVVGRWLGAAQLGVYGHAYRLMQVPAEMLGGVLHRVLLPTMAKVQQNRPALSRAYRRGVASIALAIAPLSIVLSILAPEIVDVVLGPQWADAVVPFRILALAMLFRGGYKVSESLAMATGAVYRRAWRQGLHSALIVAGALIGQEWGLAGIAWAVLIALVINYAVMAQLSIALVDVSWAEFVRAHEPALRLAAIVGTATYGVSYLTRNADLASVATIALAGLAAFGAAVAATRLLPRLFLGADGVWVLELVRGVVGRPKKTEAKHPAARD